jgi:xanthine dehydrogenase YagR molybdenum-binding subunit
MTARERRFVTTSVEVEGRFETRVVEVPAHIAPTWGPGESLQIVGQPVARVDGRDKVTGRATYTADVNLPGMLFAAFVRVPVAAGKVTAIDPAAALAIDGVLEVFTDEQLPRPIKVAGSPLLSRVIRYPGQAVAVVCAETMRAARAGARAVRVSWDEAAAVVTAAAAQAPGAPTLRTAGNVLGGAPSVVARGDVDAGLRAAHVRVERSYTTSSQLHTALEPHGAVAHWQGDHLTIWESTQGVFRVRAEVARALGIPASRVRVIQDHMGGGFGAKNNAGPHTVLAALLAQRQGRPVRCVLDRFGEQVDTGHRPSSATRVTLGADAEGRLCAIEAWCEVPLGVEGWGASVAAIFHEMYACANVRTTEAFVYTNQQGMQAFRAPGHAEGAFALERAMDALAQALSLDPLELRVRNFAAGDEARGRPYSGNGLLRCYSEGATRFEWATRDMRRNVAVGDGALAATPGFGGTLKSGGGPRALRGFGMASQVWGAGGGPPSYATVRINSDASIDVLSGTQDLGTGTRTILAQIAAESLGARLTDVRVTLGDTERTPYAGTSWGSMTTASVGPAVQAAADEARIKLLDAAAGLLECEPEDLVARDSAITTRDGARRLTFAEVTRKLGNVMIMGQGSRGPNPSGLGIMSFGAQFAEVEVDADTGTVRVVKIVAAHDVGRVINPLLAGSQLEGGILQGMGFAIGEERLLDPNTGRPVNATLHDYKLPTMADVPVIDAFCIDSVDDVANPIGARGLAEPPVIPTAPAIANAVADALGVEVNHLPLSPWRVIAALRA